MNINRNTGDFMIHTQSLSVNDLQNLSRRTSSFCPYNQRVVSIHQS